MRSSSATRFCKICFKEMTGLSWRSFCGDSPPICPHCFLEMGAKQETYMVSGVKARSLYPYNEKIRSLLFQFKGCADIELASVFLSYQLPLLKLLYRGYTMVPAPSFSRRDEARGYNHVEEMFSSLGLPLFKCLHKTKDAKQADSSYAERQKIGECIVIEKGASLKGKKILFVDDLFTTGATAKACLALLQKQRPKKIQILTMGKTHEKDEMGPKPS